MKYYLLIQRVINEEMNHWLNGPSHNRKQNKIKWKNACYYAIKARDHQDFVLGQVLVFLSDNNSLSLVFEK